MQTPQYHPLSASLSDAHARYGSLFHRTGPIEPHIVTVINAVDRALKAGHFYTDAVLAAVIEDFGDYLKPGDTEIGRGHVQGGIFGMEVYYARDFLRECEKFEALEAAARNLRLQRGMSLGCLVFNDYKLTSACTVQHVDRFQVVVAGKRGGRTYEFKTNVVAIEGALQRAFEKGKRKSASLWPDPRAQAHADDAELSLFAAV